MKFTQHLIPKNEEEKIIAKNTFNLAIAMAKNEVNSLTIMFVPKYSFDREVALVGMTRVDPRINFVAHVETSNNSNMEELIASMIKKLVKKKKDGALWRILICEPAEKLVNYENPKLQKALFKAAKHNMPVMGVKNMEICKIRYIHDLWSATYSMMF